MGIRLIVDTDLAIDDWLALGYVACHPAIDLLAITVVATGEAHADPAIKRAHGLLRLAGHAAVPIGAGRKRPLRGDNRFPWYLRWAMDVGLLLPVPKVRQAQTLSAVDLLLQQLLGSEQPIRLLCIGPLTNIGELLQLYPTIAARIERLVIMGGAVHVAGNIDSIIRTNNLTAEWNIYIDPYATRLVLESGLPITLVPLDVTNSVPVGTSFFELIKPTPNTAIATHIKRVLQRIQKINRGLYFWDPLAAFVAVHPELVQYQSMRLKVVETVGAEQGRLVEAADGALVDVCVGVDRAYFEQHFWQIVNGVVG